MSELEKKILSFFCNPAASMHEAWQPYLHSWGIPKALCNPLWQERKENGTLSRFLTERFHLSPIDQAIGENSPYAQNQKILLIESQPFENKMIRLGTVFIHQQVRQIINGDQLRQIKQELGPTQYHFLRHKTPHLVKKYALLNQTIRLPELSKKKILLLGLAVFVRALAIPPDFLTRLCLKLSPLKDQPQPPENFPALCHQIRQLKTFPSSQIVEEIFLTEQTP